jgi:outer membrane protein
MRNAIVLALLALVPSLAAAQAAKPPPAPAAPAPAPAPAGRVITLAEAEKSAREHQPQLEQAQANARAGAARADEARSALLPQLAASATAQKTHSNQRITTGPGTSTTVGSSTLWSAGVSADQTLFDLGALYRWRASQSSASSLRSAADTSRLDVVSEVRTAYFTARAQRDLARVAKETVTNNQAHLTQVQAFVDVGTQPAIALAQTKAALASAQLALIQADNAYANAKTQLAQAMGLDTWGDFEVADDTLPAVAGEDGPLEVLVTEAIEKRPELVTLAAQIRQTDETRAADRAGWLPTVGARATYAQSGPHLNDTAGSWSASVNLTWSFFDGGFTPATVRETSATIDSLRAQDRALRTSIRVALEQAFLGVRAARSSVQSAVDAETNAREQLRLAEGRYRAGAGSIIELGDAQVAESTAAAQRVQAEFNLAAARASLLRAVGRE